MGAIGLNPIRLDRIGLDPIRINAIKLGVPGASGSDRPYIDPEVLASLKAVCICYGKSNDDPDRAVVKNLVDPDNPFVIRNAAFKLNSGFGKYEADFLDSSIWVSSNSTITSSKIDCKNAISHIMLLYYNVGGKEYPNIPSFKVIKTGADIDYSYIDETGSPKSVKIVDGVNVLPASYNTLYSGSGRFCGFGNPGIGNSVTITQIPSFEGAFVTDGIDDLITSTKTVQEMLRGSSEITVVSMIHQIELNKVGTSFTNYCRKVGVGYARNETRDYGTTGIYGWSISNVNNSNSVNRNLINNILGDKELYSVDSVGDITNSIFSVNGYENASNSPSETSQLAWYWTIIANKVLTADQINQVIAYFNLDRTLNPDILCNTIKQGITNENHAEFGDKLIDFSGNGRDIQLNNIAWNKESGIDDDGALRLDGVTDFGSYVGDLGLKDYTFIADRAYDRIVISQVPFIASTYTNGQAPFLMEYSPDDGKAYPHSFGHITKTVSINKERQISYQSTYVYNRNAITKGTSIDTGDGLTIGNSGVAGVQYSALCLYSLLLFPYSMSEFLIERQLKKHKLGTLYPDMVEWRPIVKSNLPYSSISYSVNPGEYISVDSMVTITVTLPNTSDKLMEVSCNAISDISISGDNGVYEITGKIVKSPQKINLVISSYLTMLSNSTLISNETLIKNE